MACITKLANAIAYDCDSGAIGLTKALIINKADIVDFAVGSGNLVSSITLAPDAKAYKIDAVKRSLVMSTSLKVNEGAPNAFSHSVTIVSTTTSDRSGIDAAFTNGSFVVIAQFVGTRYIYVYGMFYGLSATSFERSSHENGGFTTITLETPENVIGEDNLHISEDVYDALYAAAVG